MKVQYKIAAFFVSLNVLIALFLGGIFFEFVKQEFTDLTEQQQKDLENLKLTMIATVVLTIVVSIFATIVLTYNITSPISKLHYYITKLNADGIEKFDNRKLELMFKNSHDEIGQLGEAFNSMAVSLREYFVRLQKSESTIKKQHLDLLKSDRLKDEFSAMVSHELRTPLTPILTYCDMLRDQELLGDLDGEQKEAVDEIYENSIRLERLISDILYAQKLDMDKLPFIIKSLEIEKFTHSIIKDLAPITVEKRIKLVQKIENEIVIDTDADRLAQVFRNLITNAIDFVPSNNGVIEIGASNKEDKILFYVKDNGIGIPEEKIGNLFRKFYQVDTSAKRKHGGTGLGLVICKGIIERFGGKIWVESKLGYGTTFYFTIPKECKKIEVVK